MGWGTGNLGGGSGGLNFKIVSYATESELLADTPKENTIGVITSIPITGYHFGKDEPSPAAAGMVWIPTGTSSTVEFNALKKNGIQVYPLSAKQQDGSAWVDVTALSYQGVEWVEWLDGTLFDVAVLSTHTWTLSSGGGTKPATLTYGDTGMVLGLTASPTRTGGQVWAGCIDNDPDLLSDYNTLIVKYKTSLASSNATIDIGVNSTGKYGGEWVAKKCVASNTNAQTVTIDISSVDSGYATVCFHNKADLYSKTTKATIISVKLEN